MHSEEMQKWKEMAVWLVSSPYFFGYYATSVISRALSDLKIFFPKDSNADFGTISLFVSAIGWVFFYLQLSEARKKFLRNDRRSAFDLFLAHTLMWLCIFAFFVLPILGLAAFFGAYETYNEAFKVWTTTNESDANKIFFSLILALAKIVPWLLAILLAFVFGVAASNTIVAQGNATKAIRNTWKTLPRIFGPFALLELGTVFLMIMTVGASLIFKQLIHPYWGNILTEVLFFPIGYVYGFIGMMYMAKLLLQRAPEKLNCSELLPEDPQPTL